MIVVVFSRLRSLSSLVLCVWCQRGATFPTITKASCSVTVLMAAGMRIKHDCIVSSLLFWWYYTQQHTQQQHYNNTSSMSSTAIQQLEWYDITPIIFKVIISNANSIKICITISHFLGLWPMLLCWTPPFNNKFSTPKNQTIIQQQTFVSKSSETKNLINLFNYLPPEHEVMKIRREKLCLLICYRIIIITWLPLID
jgi:hypothetical protein